MTPGDERECVLNEKAGSTKRKKMMKRPFVFVFCVVFLVAGFLMMPQKLWAGEQIGLSSGQTIYVPAYSHIYSRNKAVPFLLTVTLSIRNIDMNHPITINRVDFFETGGKLQKSFVSAPVKVQPMETIRYVIPEKESSGGSGANFIVVWQAGKPVNPPIAESVMISTQSQQGVSFTSRGRVILPSD